MAIATICVNLYGGPVMKAAKVRKRNGDRSKRVKRRDRKCKCEWCGVLFLAARYDATTCSDAHRLLWSRYRKRFLKKNGYECGYGPRGDRQRQLDPRSY